MEWVQNATVSSVIGALEVLGTASNKVFQFYCNLCVQIIIY